MAPRRAPRLLACTVLLASACAKSHTQREDRAPAPSVDRDHADAATSADRGGRAKLVVSVVIDQLGSDTLLALEPLLADDGFLAAVRAEGSAYEQVVYPYAATLTAPGHAAIYSGAAPAESGIVANYATDPQSGATRAAEDDGEHAVLDAGGAAGPGVLLVDTVGDALKAQTHGRARVVALSLKARSAVLPGGKRADLALWYNAGIPGFTTSTYYASERPAWVLDFERAHPIDAASVVWQAHDPARLAELLGPDDAPGEGDAGGLGVTFPHRLAGTLSPNDAWTFVPDAAEYLLDLAFEAAQRFELGRDDTPDLLAISISSTDYTGHAFGSRSWEYADHLRRVDRALMRLVERLRETTTLAVLVTSDHGVAPLPERDPAKPSNAVRLVGAELTDAVEEAIEGAVGGSGWVVGYDVPYMNLSAAAHTDARQAKIRAVALAALRARPGIAAAFDTRDAAALEGGDATRHAVALSIHPATSGDFFVVPERFAVPQLGFAAGTGTAHGSPWAYDSHVPVLLWGRGIAQARHAEDLDQRRVAPTLSAMLHAAPPSHATQAPLPGVSP
jgi:predicted AlkP superfamily pyrophosphatase or phosphodiesterase